MISVQEAIDTTLAQTARLPTEKVSILDAGGRILAQDVFSDIDMPPFDKSSMDGYALRAADVVKAPVILDVAGVIPAGVYPNFRIGVGQAAKIMTGAPLPEGADAVQMVEKTAAAKENQVEILEAVSSGKNVAKKSEIMKKGEKVFCEGTFISPAVIGVLATVGLAQVEVYGRPEVGILITGSELVPVEQRPEAGQIRNSNGYALYHHVLASGARPELLGIAPDKPEVLLQQIAAGLQKDVLLISGGVSMGDLDFVEDVFSKLGVTVFYDKINIKPGKPAVFGKAEGTLVFGLPGNPVSASTIFEVIVRPAIRKMMGFTQLHNLRARARLLQGFHSRTRRTYFAPAWTRYERGQLLTQPVATRGSADVLAFAKSNSYIVFPGEVEELASDQDVEVMLRDEFWQMCELPVREI